MEKMYLVSEDQYRHLRPNVPNESSTPMTGSGANTVNDDVKIEQMHDAFVRASDAKKISQDKAWGSLTNRLKPLLGSYETASKELLQSFPADKRDQVEFIVQMLAHLPRVSLTSNQLKIAGKPVADSLKTIVGDILNHVTNVEDVIGMLRGEHLDSDDESSIFESFADTIREFEQGAKAKATSTPIKADKSKNKSKNKSRRGRAKSVVTFKTDDAIEGRKRSVSRGAPSPRKVLSNVADSEIDRLHQVRSSARSRNRKPVQYGKGVAIGQWQSY